MTTKKNKHKHTKNTKQKEKKTGNHLLYNFFVYHLILIEVSLFFFFSSRRRHTRSKRDWSSDVCSSDLMSAPARRCQNVSFCAGLMSARNPITTNTSPTAMAWNVMRQGAQGWVSGA